MIEELIAELQGGGTEAEELAAVLGKFLYDAQANTGITNALHRVQQTWLLSGSPVITDETGKTRDPMGDAYFDRINLTTGFTATVNANEPRQIDITGGGGGTDCMFDYIVSSCFATLSGFTEGKVYTSLSGCTFKGYSTISRAVTQAATDFPVNGALTANLRVPVIAVCGGTYTESATATTAMTLWGAGSDSPTWIPAAGAGNASLQFTNAGNQGRSRVTGFTFHPAASQYGIFINAVAQGQWYIHNNYFIESSTATAGISSQPSTSNITSNFTAIFDNSFAGGGKHIDCNFQGHIFNNRFSDGYIVIGNRSCRIVNNHWDDGPSANGTIILNTDSYGSLIANNQFFTGNAGSMAKGIVQTNYATIIGDEKIPVKIIGNIVNPSSAGLNACFLDASSITTTNGRSMFVVENNSVDFTGASTTAQLIKAPTAATAAGNIFWSVNNNTMMTNPGAPFPNLFDVTPDEMRSAIGGNIVYGGSTGDTTETGKLALIHKGTTTGSTVIDVRSIWWPTFHCYFGSTLVGASRGTFDYTGQATGIYYVSINSTGTITPTGASFPANEIPLATVSWNSVTGAVLSVVNVTHLLQASSSTGAPAAPSDATYVTMSASAGLSAERVLTAGSNITITDGGANSTVTIATLAIKQSYISFGAIPTAYSA